MKIKNRNNGQLENINPLTSRFNGSLANGDSEEEMVAKLKQSVLEVQNGDVTRISTSKEISDLLGL